MIRKINDYEGGQGQRGGRGSPARFRNSARLKGT